MERSDKTPTLVILAELIVQLKSQQRLLFGPDPGYSVEFAVPLFFFNHFPHHLCHCRFLVSVLGDRVLVPACVIPPIFVSLSVDASCALLRTPFCYECAFLLEVFCHQESPSLRFFLWLSLIL